MHDMYPDGLGGVCHVPRRRESGQLLLRLRCSCLRVCAFAELGGRITNQTTLMSTPILDPTSPADNAPIVSGELRGQFQAIEDSFADIRARLMSPMPLGLTVSNPPTQAEVQALADKLDELINTLNA